FRHDIILNIFQDIGSTYIRIIQVCLYTYFAKTIQMSNGLISAFNIIGCNFVKGHPASLRGYNTHFIKVFNGGTIWKIITYPYSYFILAPLKTLRLETKKSTSHLGHYCSKVKTQSVCILF